MRPMIKLEMIFRLEQMTQIEQFSQEYIEKNTPEKDMLFKSFLDSQEPYTSIFKNNPWLAPPNFKKPLSRKKFITGIQQ